MLKRIELADGQWVDITPVEDLRDFDRKALNRVTSMRITDDGQAIVSGDYEDKIRDALLTRVIQDWSFPGLPVPSKNPYVPAKGDQPEKAGSLDLLTIPQARELRSVVDEHMKLIRDGGGPGERGSDPTTA
jgi:hypothetical protein